MSDESQPQQEPRLKLRLRTDKTPEGMPPAAAPIAPANLVAPVAAGSPPIPSAPPVAGPVQATPAPIRLKPRVSIRPTEPEQAGGTIVVHGLPSVPPPVGSGVPGPMGAPTEKIEIDIGPIIRPLGEGSATATIPSARPVGAEKADALFKIKLKPAAVRDVSAATVPPGLAEVNPVGKQLAAGLSLPGISDAGTMRMSAPPPRAEGIPAARKVKRLVLLGSSLALLVFLGAGYFWFFVRTPAPAPRPAAVANPPPVAPTPQPQVAAVAPRPHVSETAAATAHPPETGEPPANTTTPVQTVASAKAPAVLPLVVEAAPSAPVVVNPPPAQPPPVPPRPLVASAAFRAFVDHVKIGGVRTGPPARLVVDGVACDPGDVMNRELGVVFVGVDADKNEILFKDATGAVLRRRF